MHETSLLDLGYCYSCGVRLANTAYIKVFDIKIGVKIVSRL